MREDEYELGTVSGKSITGFVGAAMHEGHSMRQERKKHKRKRRPHENEIAASRIARQRFLVLCIESEMMVILVAESFRPKQQLSSKNYSLDRFSPAHYDYLDV